MKDEVSKPARCIFLHNYFVLNYGDLSHISNLCIEFLTVSTPLTHLFYFQQTDV